MLLRMLWKQVSRKRLSGVSGKHDKLWMLYQEFLYYVGCVFESILILNYFVCFENILNNIIYICILLFFGDASPHELYIKSFFASGIDFREPPATPQ